jgi:hypothetical protein
MLKRTKKKNMSKMAKMDKNRRRKIKDLSFWRRKTMRMSK